MKVNQLTNPAPVSLRRIKRWSLMGLSILAGMLFLMAVIFEQAPQLHSLEYIFNPFQVTIEPTPVNGQEQHWRLGS
jgi:hypothetical protein